MNDEQFALINKAKDSLKAAEVLFDSELYAFSVSRTYYSMVYLAEAVLLNEDLSLSKHSAVIATFGNSFIKTKIFPDKFHKYLIKGQNIRNMADYDTTAVISKEEAMTEIKHAQEFILFTENYLGKQ